MTPEHEPIAGPLRVPRRLPRPDSAPPPEQVREEIEGRHQEMADPVVDGAGEVHAALRAEAVGYLLSSGSWRLEDGQLRRTYHFPSVREATRFAGRVAGLDVEPGRRPSCVREACVVELALSTPAANHQVTPADTELALLIDLLADRGP